MEKPEKTSSLSIDILFRKYVSILKKYIKNLPQYFINHPSENLFIILQLTTISLIIMATYFYLSKNYSKNISKLKNKRAKEIKSSINGTKSFLNESFQKLNIQWECIQESFWEWDCNDTTTYQLNGKTISLSKNDIHNIFEKIKESVSVIKKITRKHIDILVTVRNCVFLRS